MHKALMLQQYGFDAAQAGRFRGEQVWIGPGDAGPRTVDFVAPHHDRVHAAMVDLVAFVQREDLPVLVQVALAHAQFETIHPFTDGNGRTGRALAQSVLRTKAWCSRPLCPYLPGCSSMLIVTLRRWQFSRRLTRHRSFPSSPAPAALLQSRAANWSMIRGRSSRSRAHKCMAFVQMRLPGEYCRCWSANPGSEHEVPRADPGPG